MKLSISNIAWNFEDDDEILDILVERNVNGLEVAPSKICSDMSKSNLNIFSDYRKKINDKEVDIIAMQSLLYERNDLKIFESEETREKTSEYLKMIIDVGSILGAKALVFGSPRNRDILDHSYDEAYKIALTFFRELGSYCGERNLKLCLEPNAKEYKCNFLQTTSETAQFVRDVNSDGIGFHVDAGVMQLNNEDIEHEIASHIDIIEHFHISEPFLKEIHTSSFNHKIFADALRKNGYSKWVSIEMVPENQTKETIIRSLDFAINNYR